MGKGDSAVIVRRPQTSFWVFAIALMLFAGSARADDLLDLANAELHMPTVCPANATVGIYGALTGMLTTEMFQTGEQQNGDISLVERAALDAVLAEHALAPYLDPATAPATDGLLMAKFIVLAEADLSSLPADLSVSVVRTDTQEIVCEHSSVVTEAEGLAGLSAAMSEIAQAIASIAANGHYACPRVGSLSYTVAMSGNDWAWDLSGYFDVVFRGAGSSTADLEAVVRHVPAGNQVSGLLISVTDTQFPTLPAMTATPDVDPAAPQGEPTSYLMQFSNPGAVGSKHLLVFEETPNPVFTTGQLNELELPNMAAVALGQWMRQDGGPGLQLNAQVTGGTPDSWTVPASQGMMTLTWVLP